MPHYELESSLCAVVVVGRSVLVVAHVSAPSVILSAAKSLLSPSAREILRFAQHDT
ncbi:MAG: hypothetical protein RMK92_10730 [Armatimonadota bacterium]|nr:hypothetical protein [Armatimonadota bacterium]MDW8105475.1 hypothetical protein [Armatimonadota bacterium]